MRYLLFFLFFFSSFSFAGSPTCNNQISEIDVCGFRPSQSAGLLGDRLSICTSVQGQYAFVTGECSADSPAEGGPTYSCMSSCTCPSGEVLNTVQDASGNMITSCIPDVPSENPEDLCPSGFPKVGGQCPVCPGGFNPDGTCNDPTQCESGQTKQGEINGTAVCAGSCSDPNQSWGFVNGFEGCYGAPSCPNGGSYGTVNGVSGCYGTASSSGSGTSAGSGSGTSAGTGTGTGTGTGSGTGTSTGSGTDTGTGTGSGGGGGGAPSNNSIGSPYQPAEACPTNFVKVGDYCTSSGRGDCVVGYHQLVVSRDPFLFICVQDDPLSQSSQSSQSSTPPSSSSQSSSRSSSSSSANGSMGSNTSSGSGSGDSGGDGGGSTGEGAGDCDPTSTEYLTCIAGDSNTQIKDLKLGAYSTDMQTRLLQSKDKYNQKIQSIRTQFQDQMSLNISGASGGLPSHSITLYGESFEAGIAARSDFFDAIRWAFFACAAVLSLYIVLSR